MNIKKIGLSALAGSLAMVSANAVEVAVTGKTEVTYMSKDIGVTGNPWGMGNALTFKGSGDVNGYTATYTTVLQDGGTLNTNSSETFASSSLMLDMGDMGTVGFDQGVGEFGVGTIDDKMPYAYEEIWTYVGGATSLAASGGTNQNVLGYKNTFMGYQLSIELDPGQKASAGGSGDGGATGIDTPKGGYNYAITGSPFDGLNIGVGVGEEDVSDTSFAEDRGYHTQFATYAIGGATVGYQRAENNGGSTGTANSISQLYGVSFAVNENLALSYNETLTDIGTGANKALDEKVQGFGASYTMGSAAVRIVSAKIKNKGSLANSLDETATEVSLMLAF